MVSVALIFKAFSCMCNWSACPWGGVSQPLCGAEGQALLQWHLGFGGKRWVVLTIHFKGGEFELSNFSS